MAYLKWRFKAEELEGVAIMPDFAEDFYHYLTLELDNPINPITARNQLKRVKQILSRLVSKQAIVRNRLEGFVVGVDENEVIPLEQSEVETIYRKQMPVTCLDEVRDGYVFQCFTGFAYQEVFNLATENIVEVGLSAERWLIRKRGETKVTEMVPILPIVEQLIEKYKDHPCRRQKGKLLPIKSNSHYNGYLKEIAVLCGVRCHEGDQPLNTHLARHTFADIMLNNGVPLEDVSRMQGQYPYHAALRPCAQTADIGKC